MFNLIPPAALCMVVCIYQQSLTTRSLTHGNRQSTTFQELYPTYYMMMHFTPLKHQRAIQCRIRFQTPLTRTTLVLQYPRASNQYFVFIRCQNYYQIPLPFCRVQLKQWTTYNKEEIRNSHVSSIAFHITLLSSNIDHSYKPNYKLKFVHKRCRQHMKLGPN